MVVAACEYGDAFPAVVWHENIVATQFHPEKSQDNGLRLLANFLAWTPAAC
jgi:imidazole glycerol-phosphate synthase subunit HisH